MSGTRLLHDRRKTRHRTELEIIDSVQADLRVSVGVAHAARLALENPGCVPSTLAHALDHVQTTLEHVIADVMELDDHRRKREGAE